MPAHLRPCVRHAAYSFPEHEINVHRGSIDQFRYDQELVS